jgi:hypothetical protein
VPSLEEAGVHPRAEPAPRTRPSRAAAPPYDGPAALSAKFDAPPLHAILAPGARRMPLPRAVILAASGVRIFNGTLRMPPGSTLVLCGCGLALEDIDVLGAGLRGNDGDVRSLPLVYAGHAALNCTAVAPLATARTESWPRANARPSQLRSLLSLAMVMTESRFVAARRRFCPSASCQTTLAMPCASATAATCRLRGANLSAIPATAWLSVALHAPACRSARCLAIILGSWSSVQARR